MQETTKKEVLSWVKSFIIAIIIVTLTRYFLFTPVTVKGESMEPTFEANNRIIVSKISNIMRFDVIVFHAPDENKQYIKRVIGLPGDQVRMEDDILYINDLAYEEDYVNRFNEFGSKKDQITENFTLRDITGESIVPEGHLFVLGDNRLKSRDSRDFGLISEEAIVGEVKFRFFPLNKAGVP